MVAGSAELTRANSRLFAAETLTDTFLGPPLGGALVTVGIGLAWGGATLGYVVALFGLTLLRGGVPGRPHGHEPVDARRTSPRGCAGWSAIPCSGPCR